VSQRRGAVAARRAPLEVLQRQLLAARDARANTIARLASRVPEGGALLFLSLNASGVVKRSPLLDRLFGRVRGLLAVPAGGGGPDRGAAGPRVGAFELRGDSAEGCDALGRWLAVTGSGDAVEIKRRSVHLEETLPGGRLVDLDVYTGQAEPVSRVAIELPPRRCLACSDAAVNCIRAGRHTAADLARAVGELLRAGECACLAEALVEGARVELALTPKPGLVDRHDNGSHPDLSFDLMSRSIDLLPEYFAELGRLAVPDGELDLDACIAAGRRAEQRMLDAVGTNAHRGYIFLAGLVLVGFAECLRGDVLLGEEGVDREDGAVLFGLRESVARLATRVAAVRPAPPGTHGDEARRRHRVGGILVEATRGLPSVFDHALPALDRAEARFGRTDRAHHRMMAELMTVVEDTTALHRCGLDGLEQIRRDGHRVGAAIDRGDDHVPLLERLNTEYRAKSLTMGGVADCLALAIGLRLARAAA
jgi:triphosphoribosyl-dephospho-CoA synthase